MSKIPPCPGYEFYVHENRVDEIQPGYQRLAREVAVAISYNGLNHAVMMATPQALEDFARGYSLSAGIVSNSTQLLDIQIHDDQGEDAVRLDIALTHRAFHAYKLHRKISRRADIGASACGLCGVEALEQVFDPSPMVTGHRINTSLPSPRSLHDLRGRFRDCQPERDVSGAMHAAIYVDANGDTRVCREDIGRHNALDKLIGACSKQGLSLERGFVAISSRCGFELVQKAVRCGIANLVSLSSPSDIAVRWARQHRLNLIHVPASGAPRVYSTTDTASAGARNKNQIEAETP